jgi:hypothetical protein
MCEIVIYWFYLVFADGASLFSRQCISLSDAALTIVGIEYLYVSI